jgi:hypothetical protein
MIDEAISDVRVRDLNQLEKNLFWRALYPHAWVLAVVIKLFRPSFFETDYELIRHLLESRSRKDIADHITYFHTDWRNKRFIRRRLKIRISTDRLRVLIPSPQHWD